MVKATDLKSVGETRAGSNPAGCEPRAVQRSHPTSAHAPLFRRSATPSPPPPLPPSRLAAASQRPPRRPRSRTPQGCWVAVRWCREIAAGRRDRGTAIARLGPCADVGASFGSPELGVKVGGREQPPVAHTDHSGVHTSQRRGRDHGWGLGQPASGMAEGCSWIQR